MVNSRVYMGFRDCEHGKKPIMKQSGRGFFVNKM